MTKNISKKTIIIIIIAAVLLIALAIGGYLYWQSYKKLSEPEGKTPEENGDSVGKLVGSVTKGVLPSIGTNPLENKPDLNPADKANPFKNIKTNPFE